MKAVILALTIYRNIVIEVNSYLSLKYKASLFTDKVSGKGVKLYEDMYGDMWMKDNKWAFFKVPYDRKDWDRWGHIHKNNKEIL